MRAPLSPVRRLSTRQLYRHSSQVVLMDDDQSGRAALGEQDQGGRLALPACPFAGLLPGTPDRRRRPQPSDPREPEPERGHASGPDRLDSRTVRPVATGWSTTTTIVGEGSSKVQSNA